MKKIILLCYASLIAISNLEAQSGQMVSQAKAFINLLTATQQSKTVYPFLSDERYSFHFFPIPDRKGLSFNEMNPAQKNAAFAMLRSCLSAQAFKKTQEIMSLESILKILEKRAPEDHYRDTGNYCFTIFGEPAVETDWGWRFEGHHVVFNFSYSEKKLVSGTPGFFGANPAIVKEGDMKGKQVLKEEADGGYNMMKSLSADQLAIAAPGGPAPNDILSFISRKPLIENNQGILYRQLNASQQQKLLQLISIYVHRYTKLFADQMLKDIQAAGLDNLRFLWLGSQDVLSGQAHYYRIQGPTLLIEYDNSQNNANHAHTVIRDLKNDFGGDLLSEHYKAQHNK